MTIIRQIHDVGESQTGDDGNHPLVFDNETGEIVRGVSIWEPDDLALQTAEQLVAFTEQIRDYTVARLEASFALPDIHDLRINNQMLRTAIAQTLHDADTKRDAKRFISDAILRSERQVGKQIPGLRETGLLAERGDNLRKGIATPSYLRDYGISNDQSKIWQKYARIADPVLEDYIATCYENQWEISGSGFLRFAQALPSQLVQQSEINEWYTPRQYIEAARRTMGAIDLDPASCEYANKTVQADRYFDLDDDGLNQEWYGRVWLNPPYGDQNIPFIAKLLVEVEAGHVDEAVILVNSHSTETRWFAPLWDYILCFTDHRINFISPGGEQNGSTHGSVFIYLGPHEHAFKQHFDQFGYVVKRV